MTSVLLSYAKNFIFDSLLNDFPLLPAELQNFVFDELSALEKTSSASYTDYDSLPFDFSIYNKTIPIIAGTVRVKGCVIWTSQLKNEYQDNDSLVSSVISFAVGICDGEISDISAIWINDTLVQMSSINFDIYYGTQDQSTDPTILMHEEYSTAYRGIAYVVIKNFDISSYRNKIPRFDFEVTSAVGGLNKEIANVCIGYGDGEDIYETSINKKIKHSFTPDHKDQIVDFPNYHNTSSIADILLSIKQMKKQLPNATFASVNVSWVATSADAANAKIYPAIEFSYSNTYSKKIEWGVAGYLRQTGYRPQYILNEKFGTPSDKSVVLFVKELQKQGYSVSVSPTFVIDSANGNWRGLLTGSSSAATTFVEQEYSKFIMHYANLLVGLISCFVIGSDLAGLTKIVDENGQYKVVDALIKLAGLVKGVLGSNVTVTYAAGWNEYHSINKFYNMDKLWSSSDIDVIGINAYFPITDIDKYNANITKKQIISLWNSGYGFDYFYDEQSGSKTDYTDSKFAWKNIEYWWANEHVHPDGTKSSWVPKLKKIWFMELGFPTVDLSTNEPNALRTRNNPPAHSTGKINFDIQRVALEASLEFWKASEFVEKIFVWKWNPKPYPFFPDLEDVWNEAPTWYNGYDLNGKLTRAKVSEVLKVSIGKSAIKVSQDFDLQSSIAGFLIDSPVSIKKLIENLRLIGQFYLYEDTSGVNCFEMGNDEPKSISYNDFIPIKDNSFIQVIKDYGVIPNEISMTFFNRRSGYILSNTKDAISSRGSSKSVMLKLRFVAMPEEAKRLCEINLLSLQSSCETYKCILPTETSNIHPLDVILITDFLPIPIKAIVVSSTVIDGTVQIIARSYNPELYSRSFALHAFTKNTNKPKKLIKRSSEFPQDDNALRDLPYYAGMVNNDSEVVLKLLDIPSIYDRENMLYFPLLSNKSERNPYSIFMSDDLGETYKLLLTTYVMATYGYTLTKLSDGPTDTFDQGSTVVVKLENGGLSSASELSVFNDANLALIDDEIVQFCNAELIAENTYVLSKLIRGKSGTPTSNHLLGGMFILLRQNTPGCVMPVYNRGKNLFVKSVSPADKIQDMQEVSLIYQARSATPLPIKDISCSISFHSRDILFLWNASVQSNCQWIDYADIIPDSGHIRNYIVSIFDIAGTKVKDENIDQPSYTYPSDTRIKELGSKEAKFFIEISEFSTYTGNGPISGLSVIPEDINILTLEPAQLV